MQFWIQIEKQNKFQAILSHESSGVGCSLQLKTIQINAKMASTDRIKKKF